MLLLALGKVEGLAARLARDVSHDGDLLLDAAIGTGELEEQGGCLGPLARGGARHVDEAHLVVVEDLDGGDLDAVADDAGDAVGGVADGGEAGDGDRAGGGLDGELEGGFCHEAEGALGADEELGEVVAGAALARALAGLDDGAVGEDDSEGEHPLAHGAVAVGVGAAAPGADHAADHGARAWVRGKEEVVVGELVVEMLPSHGGLDNDVEVVLVQGEDFVHAREVDADSAAGRGEVALETSAAAIAHDGDAAGVADLHDVGHLLGRARVDDAEGPLGGIGLVRGPVRGGVLLDVIGDGAHVLLADDFNEVGPGGLERGRAGLVHGRLCRVQGERRCRVGVARVLVAEDEGGTANEGEHCSTVSLCLCTYALKQAGRCSVLTVMAVFLPAPPPSVMWARRSRSALSRFNRCEILSTICPLKPGISDL